MSKSLCSLFVSLLLPFARHFGAAAVALAGVACAAAPQPRPALTMVAAVTAPPPATPALLVDDHFVTDRAGSLSEAQLREILAAPVFLEADARIGVVPVIDGYASDVQVPISNVTGALANALASSGQFEVVSEVSTDFPATGSVAGLRELAARYRSDYLLLYRHRFIDEVHNSAWSWAWATLVLPLAVPVHTLSSEGVLEATLFDTRTGTILFTAFERVRGARDENTVDVERKHKALKEELLEKGSVALADDVVDQIKRLAAARVAFEARATDRAAQASP